MRDDRTFSQVSGMFVFRACFVEAGDLCGAELVEYHLKMWEREKTDGVTHSMAKMHTSVSKTDTSKRCCESKLNQKGKS